MDEVTISECRVELSGRAVESGGSNQRTFVLEGCKEVGKVPGGGNPVRQEISPLFEQQCPM